MNRLVDAVCDLLAPPRCLVCRRVASPPWCDGCAAAAARLWISRGCPRCGAAEPARHGCWTHDAPVDASLAAYRYEGVIAATVVAAKVRGAREAWPALGSRLAAAVANAPAEQFDAVAWVPADRRRRRERGVDHARVLAREVADAARRPLVAALAAAPGRSDQASLAPTDRRRLPADAFRPAARLSGARVVLVDDVLTTGATATVAAAALRTAGAVSVRVAVLARAGSHALGGRAWSGPSG